MLIKLNKKAQLGDTLTWIVATIIIFVILSFFIFGSSVLGKTKDATQFKPSLFSKEGFEPSDTFLTKSLLTYIYFENSRDGKELDKKLAGMETDGAFEESLADRLSELKSRAKI